MKNKFNLFALLLGAGLLSACGGSNMLGTSDAEDHKLIPDVVTEDPNPQRPTAGLPVLRAKDAEIQVNGQNIRFHGINLQYAEDPVNRYKAIKPISEVGSNVIRVALTSTTTTSDLEAALNSAITNKMYVILSLADTNLFCSDDEVLFSAAIKATWLKKFLPIIHQDRYQNYLMINIANGWGPKDVFNATSTGYKVYIDNYKTAIRAFRKAGFQVPLMIDAPCGTDYYAFDADRGRELLAADEEKNLILSVSASGSAWNNNTKLDNAFAVLRKQKMPIIMSEFGGSGVGDKPVNHKQILEKGADNWAAATNIPWKDPQDKVAYIIPLNAPVDISNTDISFDTMFDEAYITDGKMGFQMYLRDENGEYANTGWNGVWQQTAGKWTTQKASIKNKGSFGWASDNFNMKRVTKVGIEIVSNGKPVDVTGLIKFDNFKIVEGSGAKELFSKNFQSDITGWDPAWAGTTVALDAGGNGVALTRATGNDQIVAIYKGIKGVDFTKPITIKANIYVPSGYSGSWTYGKFFNSEGTWLTSSDLGALTYGAWNEVILTADFKESGAGLSQLGIQIGNLGKGDGTANPNFYGAIIIKDLVISGVAVNAASKVGVIYDGTFDIDEDNWVGFSWGDLATVKANQGSLEITATDFADRIDIQHKNPAKIEGLNFKEPWSLKTRIFVPSHYASISTFGMQFYLQDGAWSHHFNVFELTADKIKFGEWNDIEVKNVVFPDGFAKEALPKHMGFSFYTNLGGGDGPAMSKTDPIKIDTITFEGLIPVEKEEVVVALVDFFYPTTVMVDFTAGVIIPDDLAGKMTSTKRAEGFSWIASSWYGNSGANAPLDLTSVLDSSINLTDRGNDIVNGKGGLKYYVVPVPAN